MGHRVLESFVGLRERVGRVVAPTHTRRQTMHCFYYYKQEPLAHFNISEGAETRRRRSRRRRPLWFLELLSSVTSLAVSLASSPSLSLSRLGELRPESVARRNFSQAAVLHSSPFHSSDSTKKEGRVEVVARFWSEANHCWLVLCARYSSSSSPLVSSVLSCDDPLRRKCACIHRSPGGELQNNERPTTCC